jgi:hypothetical protein
MIALTIVLGLIVLLLGVLVAGLLRSHADILKALHDLGVGVGEPTDERDNDRRSDVGRAGAAARPAPVTMGPPLPAERDSSSVPTIAGVTPAGDALAVAPARSDRLTLLAFLSSGCASCAGFWKDLGAPEDLGLPSGTRLVVVTKGPDREIPAEVAAIAPPGLSVVMSSDAWSDYEVPGAPFFVLVDGRTGRRIGEGVANHATQVADLVRRAEVDVSGGAAGSRGRAVGLDGPQRESANDRELTDAGILPGDPSLYPTSLEEIFGPPGAVPRSNPDRFGRAS